MMLSGSPFIVENFYRNDVLMGIEKPIRGVQPGYDRHYWQKTLRQKNDTGRNSVMDESKTPTKSSTASAFKTTAMSAFNSSQRDADYPIINVEAENEHFELSDTVISWMETFKQSGKSNYVDEDDDDDDELIFSTDELGDTRESSSTDLLRDILPPPSTHHELSAPGMAWGLIKIFSERNRHLGGSLAEFSEKLNQELEQQQEQQSVNATYSPDNPSPDAPNSYCAPESAVYGNNHVVTNPNVRMRGNSEWAPPRAQIIFNIHEETNFRRLMQRQNYRCAGCGTKIDLELARRLVLYCYYLGKYFCKCCFSHKAINLPCYILQKWDFHKYPVSHFALQLLDRIANEPLFNINDINPALYRKVKKLRHLVDIRMQLFYLNIYISTCTQTDKLNSEFTSFTHQHLLQDDVHLYSLNNLIEIQHGKLYEYLNDLVARSIGHIAQCDRCRAKGHYCQLCGPSSLMSSMRSSNNNGGSMAVEPKLKHSSSIGQSIYAAVTSVGGQMTSKATAADGLTSTVSPRQPQASHSRSSSGTYSSITLSNSGLSPSAAAQPQLVPQVISVGASNHIHDHELIFPFEIGRVAQCRGCGCCFHIQCFMDVGQNCPKCERIQRRRAEVGGDSANTTDTEQIKTEPVEEATIATV